MSDAPDYSMNNDQDWTWVLERPCPDCGYNGPVGTTTDIAPALRRQVEQYQRLAAHELSAVRPEPQVWSAHEYCCHVRDVYELFARRLALMLNEDDPLFDNWDPDVTAREERYDLQDHDRAVADLTRFGLRLADMFAELADEQWQRTGRRTDGASFTVETFGRYLVHDPHHHLWDIEQGYASLAD